MKWVKHGSLNKSKSEKSDPELYWNIPDTTNKVLK